jgi:alpha-D-ribose 1-methylphosphonate 5-triphosphate synthase subunit PhnG
MAEAFAATGSVTAALRALGVQDYQRARSTVSCRLGVGHVLGRDTAHAQCVAQLDALLQRPDLQAGLLADLVAPLAAQQEEARRQQRAETEATRVRFFTLQPEVS